MLVCHENALHELVKDIPAVLSSLVWICYEYIDISVRRLCKVVIFRPDEYFGATPDVSGYIYLSRIQ